MSARSPKAQAAAKQLAHQQARNAAANAGAVEDPGLAALRQRRRDKLAAKAAQKAQGPASTTDRPNRRVVLPPRRSVPVAPTAVSDESAETESPKSTRKRT